MNRMARWRQQRQFKKSGIQQQLCVWCAKEELPVTRQLLDIICEVSPRGRELRKRLAQEFLSPSQLLPATPVTPGSAQYFEFEDRQGSKANCLVIQRSTEGHAQIAFLQNSLWRVAEVFPSVATLARQKFFPALPPSAIDWFDVIPTDGATVLTTAIYRVSMPALNGIYHDPEWKEVENEEDINWISSVFVKPAFSEGDTHADNHR